MISSDIYHKNDPMGEEGICPSSYISEWERKGYVLPLILVSGRGRDMSFLLY